MSHSLSVMAELLVQKYSDSVRNEFGSVRFKERTFSSDIIVIYYSHNSKYESDIKWHHFDVNDVTHNNDNK